ncbi:MAG: hypothetical protein VKJ87_02805 [Synechococcus sp.]|nr:hypothetical protein [Synechococcus sp.]
MAPLSLRAFLESFHSCPAFAGLFNAGRPVVAVSGFCSPVLQRNPDLPSPQLHRLFQAMDVTLMVSKGASLAAFHGMNGWLDINGVMMP